MGNNSSFYKGIFNELRIAINIACSWISTSLPIYIRNEVQEIKIDPTICPPNKNDTNWRSVIWIEPQLANCLQTLQAHSHELGRQSKMALVLTLPTLQLLNSKPHINNQPFSWSPRGVIRIIDALQESGLITQGLYGIHTGQSILINRLASYIRFFGGYARADRLEFIARQNYVKLWNNAWSATCLLILAVKT